MRIQRSIHEPLRENPSFDARWNGPDKGLITCWEVGRKKSIETPTLANRAKNGELPQLGWKGGYKENVENPKDKYGPLNYLAQWQGLRGEDLDIDLSEEVEIVCSKLGVKVTYTPDSRKFITHNDHGEDE